jgi:hypothetical protein
MTKKLVIVAALMTFCGSVFAQDTSDEENASEGGGFLSGISLKTNNKFQVSLMLGNSDMFNQKATYYLRTDYKADNIGLGDGAVQSADPEAYLQLNSLGDNSLLNMAGINFAYYITEGLDVNMSFGMDLRSTPKKSYVEPFNANGMNIQGAKWMEGRVTNNWFLTAGSNYHFKVTNEKIDFYGGLKVGYQHGQLTVTTPYTDEEAAYLDLVSTDGNGRVNDDHVHTTADITVSDANEKGERTTQKDNGLVVDGVVSNPRSGAGQINCITFSVTAGVSYKFAQGLSIGVEFEPYAYRYSMLEVCPKAARVYQAAHYANRFFASPMLKFGFRF